MDSVVIKVYGPNIKITKQAQTWFVPELNNRKYVELSETEKKASRFYLRHFVFHPPSQADYSPKIEVFEILSKKKAKDIQYFLKLTFSVPKLLYKNSLQEVTEKDWPIVVDTLKRKLYGAGIAISEQAIVSAPVSAVHVAKNIVLPRDIRMQDILAEISLTDISKVFDVTKKEVKNGGRWLHIYSGTTERVFYDKVLDAMRPKNKRKDKTQIDYERKIIEKYGLQKREVYRYEYRITKGQTVKRDVNPLLGQKDLRAVVTFKDLFRPGLCKKLLLKSWADLVGRPENQLALLGSSKDAMSLLQHILSNAKELGETGHSMNKALTSYGLARSVREYGVKEVRRAVETEWSAKHSDRLTKKLKLASKLVEGLAYSNAIEHIDQMLQEYEVLTLDKLDNLV